MGINYSTAKTILRVYRREHRILKKTSTIASNLNLNNNFNFTINELENNNIEPREDEIKLKYLNNNFMQTQEEKSQLLKIKQEIKNVIYNVGNLFKDIQENKDILNKIIILGRKISSKRLHY